MKALLAAVAVARVWTPAGIATDQYEATPTFTPDGRMVTELRRTLFDLVA